jgi:hypothetical protein
MKAYLIEGRCGEYSDHRTWPVCAYLNEARARDKVDQLERNAKEAAVKFGDDFRYHLYDDKVAKEIREFIGDSSFQSDYTGTSYHYYEIDIVDLGWPERPEE